ncbi:MAG: DEAD/DEAH box helicase, partial [Duncaniella sp.]|nr:DEAD/DEAH box helicase [Duncaniella sp.]
MLGSLDDFNSRYANPIQRDNDKDATESLRRKIFPFMLRRLKKDVLKDLPDRIEQTMYVEMESEQKAFYEQRRRYYKERVTHTLATEGLQRSQFVMFQALSELRRIASVPESLTDGKIPSPKVEMLVERLVESVANGHKAVVFFNFIAGIELVGEQLDREGIYYASMTGSTRDRQSIVERFQNDRDCKVLLMTLKTGGVGLNLTSADTVFIFEPWWNKAAEEQAVNRLHRIGQKAKGMSYSIITHDTIEEKIMQLQQQKAQLFDSLINSDSSATKLLTEEDINFILS